MLFRTSSSESNGEASTARTTVGKRTATPRDESRKRTPKASSTVSTRGRQQTLTQIQFVPRPFKFEPADLEMIEDPQQDHPRGRSTKKKTKPKNTLTQMDYLAIFGPEQAEELDMDYIDEATGPRGKKRKPGPARADDKEEEDIAQRTKRRKTSIAGNTELASAKRRKSDGKGKATIYEDEDESTPVSRQTRSSAAAGGSSTFAPTVQTALQSNTLLETPKRSRRLEIPSSQTPESLPPSTRRQIFTSSPIRTPLKERSTNTITSPSKSTMQVPLKLPGSSPLYVKPNKKRKIIVLPVAMTSQGAVGRGALHFTQRRSSWSTPPKLTLQSTVPDSEEESQNSLPPLNDLFQQDGNEASGGTPNAKSDSLIEQTMEDGYQAGHETQAVLLNLGDCEDDRESNSLGIHSAADAIDKHVDFAFDDEDGIFTTQSPHMRDQDESNRDSRSQIFEPTHDDDLAVEAQLNSTMLQSCQSPEPTSSPARSPTKHDLPTQAQTPRLRLSQISTQGTPQHTSSASRPPSSPSKVPALPPPPDLPSSSPTKSSSPLRPVLSTQSDAWKRALELDSDAPLVPPRTRLTESMMESLPGPPPWSQESFDDTEQVWEG